MDPEYGGNRTSHIVQNEDAGTMLLKYNFATVLIPKIITDCEYAVRPTYYQIFRILLLNLSQPQSPWQSLHDRRAPLHRPDLRTTRGAHPIGRGVRTYPLHRNVPSHGTRWITST